METRHTPGPWKDGPVFNKEGRAVFFTDTSEPGKWQRRVDDRTGVFSADDARLIAAAPELLQALIEAEAGLEFAGADQMTQTGDFVPAPLLALRAVRAAIAKATGSPQ